MHNVASCYTDKAIYTTLLDVDKLAFRTHMSRISSHANNSVGQLMVNDYHYCLNDSDRCDQFAL